MIQDETGHLGGAALTVSSVPRRRLADLAYDELKRRIISGDLPMGTRLVEAPLAKGLGLSRAPVREAMRRLTKEGLTVEYAHQGTFVCQLDVGSLVDLYNVRLGLETVAIRLATRRGASTTRLKELVDTMSTAAATGDHLVVARQELEFHAALCESSG
ncbi:MAG: GntR family transcriptional regulator, partial [Micromonosporaceae bacterium]